MRRQNSYPWNFLWLLRLGGPKERKEHRAKAKQMAFFPPDLPIEKSKPVLSPAGRIENPKWIHLVTLSARNSTDCGIVRPTPWPS